MTCLDISSVRDYSKVRLRKMLIDFYHYSTYPIGPPDPNQIELKSNYDQLINLTNKNLFKDFDPQESYLFAKQAFERPKAFIYVKLLDTNKFIKKLGDFLIELRIVKMKPNIVLCRSTTLPIAKLSRLKSKNDLKRLKVNAVISKPKMPKELFRNSKLGAEKVRLLERKMKYGFDRKIYSDHARKSLKDVFQQNSINSSLTIGKTMDVLYQTPPNWNYCTTYELSLKKIINPSDLFLEIDVRLIEFLDVASKQSKIVKTLPLSDLKEDQFLDVVIIRDLKKFYSQTIQTINNQESSAFNFSFFSLDNYILKSRDSFLESNNQQDNDNTESTQSKLIESKDSISSDESCLNRNFEKDKKSLFNRMRFFFKNRMVKKQKNETKGAQILKNVISDSEHSNKSNLGIKQSIKIDKPLNAKQDLTIESSLIKAKKKRKKIFQPFLNVFKPKLASEQVKQPDKETTQQKIKSRKVKKHKFENAAFLSMELQLGTKVDASKDKRLYKCLNHIDAFIVLALDGKKSYLNSRDLRNQSSWRFIYTPYQIFILNQNKIHQTINSLEDAICRTIALAKIYSKYARIKNFCYLNSSINDLLFQYSLSSKQPWFNELSQMLEEYLFENLEMIFKAEMPASLMTIYKYNYSKYGEFLFDNQVQLILGVITIKGLNSQSDQMEKEDNVFMHPLSDDETIKDKVKKRKNLFIMPVSEVSSNSVTEDMYKDNHLISSTQTVNGANLNLLGSMAKGFERCAQIWMQYMETQKPANNLEELVHFSRALKTFCTGLIRVFNRQQKLIAKRVLSQKKNKDDKIKDESNMNTIAKKHLTLQRLPRFVVQSLINLHLTLDSHIYSWIPDSLKTLIDKLVLPVDYDEATDVAKRNAIFQASPYKDIYNSLRITVEKLQDIHKEQIQVQVTVQTIQGWFPLNVTQAWIAEEIQRVELECSNWDEFFKELAFIKSDYKIDKMEKLNLMTEQEKQVKEKEFKDFLNEMVTKKLDDLVTSTLNEVIDSSDKNDLLTNTKLSFLARKASPETLKENDSKNIVKMKTLLNETETKVRSKEDKIMPKESNELKNGKSKEPNELASSELSSKESDKFKEPAEQIKYELEKLIKNQAITSQLVDKLILNEDRKEKVVQNILESFKEELNDSKDNMKNFELNKSKLEDKLKEELEKIKKEKELEEEEKRKKLEEKIREEFNSFKQAKSDRFNKRLQKFGQLKPIELINLMESCYENLIAFVSWPHAIFPAKTAKEIVYCIDLIAVILKKFYQLLEHKSRSDFENLYKNSLDQFIYKIQNVNFALMDNSFVDPDLRMNVVEWTDYQEKSWRGVVISLECSKQINLFCILNETKADSKLRMPKRKLMISRKKY